MLNDIMLFVHVVSATLLGFYIVLPFIWGKANDMLADAQYSYVYLIHVFNRIGQLALLFSLITGGYLIGKPEGDSLQLMIVGIVLLLLIGGITGMAGSRLKKMLAANKSGKLIIKEISGTKVIFWINALLVLVTLYIMVARDTIFPLW